MKELSSHFKRAVRDYLYLMEHHYPEKSTLKLVSDRYALSGAERSMLFRGVMTEKTADERKKKTVTKPVLGSVYTIDGYNVFRTVGSYLTGNLVFRALDGFLRDAAEIHKKAVSNEIVYKSVDLVLSVLQERQPSSVRFLLDRPVTKSGELAAYLNNALSARLIHGKAETVYAPDHYLKNVKTGVICTSDSAIIDDCRTSVFDLADDTLYSHFSPEIIQIQVVR